MGELSSSVRASDGISDQAKHEVKPTNVQVNGVERSTKASQLSEKRTPSRSNTMNTSDGEISDSYDEVPRDLGAQVLCMHFYKFAPLSGYSQCMKNAWASQ
jgi:hypothetical protein